MTDDLRPALTGISVDLPGGGDLDRLWTAASTPLNGDLDFTRQKTAALERVVDDALSRARLDHDPDSPPTVLLCTQAAIPDTGTSPFFQGPPAGGLDTRLGRLPVMALSHACATGGFAIDLASSLIRADPGRPVVVAGASLPDPGETLSMEAVGALTGDRVRPFDRRRSGIAIGRGAAALSLEAVSSARARRAPVRAVIGGSAVRAARGKTDTDQACARSVIDEALAGARTVDAVCAHATGTVVGDRAEFEVLRSYAADHRRDGLPVYSVKGAVGHLLHTSALVGAAHAVLALERSAIPATEGCDEPFANDPHLRVTTAEEQRPLRRLLVNAFGFGGNYASFTVERPDLLENP
ncbi:beta-ketoacyl synthase N-terminal-like domain-containing protein [Salininema proteolyticum]|uniref:Beta-ketoacyl synthase N-terminal-like domain-containing protein n=1 Tax=Salininema proteolyticum TaxID=1607685 RepID=A0ABV8U1C5_9ACTN